MASCPPFFLLAAITERSLPFTSTRFHAKPSLRVSEPRRTGTLRKVVSLIWSAFYFEHLTRFFIRQAVTREHSESLNLHKSQSAFRKPAQMIFSALFPCTGPLSPCQTLLDHSHLPLSIGSWHIESEICTVVCFVKVPPHKFFENACSGIGNNLR
jgi:hypothetical protein